MEPVIRRTVMASGCMQRKEKDMANGFYKAEAIQLVITIAFAEVLLLGWLYYTGGITLG